ncbi:MAG: ribonuclease R [Rhizobiaceae bacterium MnEN-MB40S]|nr:MAG: ribonuclease R [Rhizobiaceae bacterium MnEN-MB40S]
MTKKQIRKGDAKGAIPDRETVLRFIAENPNRASKRDIAKAFSLKGQDRIDLKLLLKDLENDGLLEKRRKTLVRPGSLPPVTVLEIVAREDDGSLMARPSEWPHDGSVAPAVRIRAERPAKNRKRGPAPGVGDQVLARIAQNDDPADAPFTGRIMKVLERSKGFTLGVFRSTPGGGGRIEPVERRDKEILIAPDDVGKAKDGDLVEVQSARSGRHGLNRGKIQDVVGSVASERAISTIALHAHGIPHVFPPAVLDEATKADHATMKNREDWRKIPLVTIDPADAKDHDDAVFAEADDNPENKGGVIVYVAIADVAWYVRPDTALDREAFKRGNSVYFPDRVVPMLPERISNDLCSLKEGVDRPALAVRMIFNHDGRKIGHTFHRVMMKSAARLAYAQAQQAIDGHPDDKTGTLLDGVLKPLWLAYGVLKRGRDRRQPLDLDLPERKIRLNDDGSVADVIVPDRLDAHRLIEEFMIQANVAAAESLERKRQPLIYRIHDEPSLAKQEALREFLKTLNMSLSKGNLRSNSFNGILAGARDEPYETMVSEMVLRSQSQAVYSPDNIGHFGLNLRKYAHFTSPIRRYADLIVHRALIAAYGLGEGGVTAREEENLEEIAAEISAFERRAMAAERDTVDRLIAHHLADRVGEIFNGQISGVTRSGLFVSLPQFGADGFVPVSTLGLDYYIYDESHQAMVGEKSGMGYRLGDRVEVRLAEAIPLAGALRFEMLSEGRKLPTATRSFHKANSSSRKQRGPVRRGRRRG